MSKKTIQKDNLSKEQNGECRGIVNEQINRILLFKIKGDKREFHL